jgi:hypothetical protein
MEYLDGMTLKHRIGNRPMKSELVVSLAIGIEHVIGTPCKVCGWDGQISPRAPFPIQEMLREN